MVDEVAEDVGKVTLEENMAAKNDVVDFPEDKLFFCLKCPLSKEPEENDDISKERFED